MVHVCFRQERAVWNPDSQCEPPADFPVEVQFQVHCLKTFSLDVQFSFLPAGCNGDNRATVEATVEDARAPPTPSPDP